MRQYKSFHWIDLHIDIVLFEWATELGIQLLKPNVRIINKIIIIHKSVCFQSSIRFPIAKTDI